MARYSMYSGEEIDYRFEEDFERKALVMRPANPLRTNGNQQRQPINEIQNAASWYSNPYAVTADTTGSGGMYTIYHNLIWSFISDVKLMMMAVE